jgi:membrane protease YdiL (CAAX protease family)
MQDVTLPAIILLGTLMTASLLVWVLTGTRVWQGRSVISVAAVELPRVHWVSAVLVLAWVTMLLLTLIGAPSSDAGKVPSLVGVQTQCLFNGLFFLGLVIPLVSREQPETASLGFHLDGWPQQIWLGVVGFLVCVAPVIAAWSTTLPWRTKTSQHGLLQLLEQDDSLVALAWIVLAAVVLAPLLEELMYRVILQTWLQRIAPPREALIAVAVVFAAVHRLPDAVPLLPLALILGYLYQQTRSFLTVVVTHMLFNATNLALAVM